MKRLSYKSRASDRVSAGRELEGAETGWTPRASTEAACAAFAAPTALPTLCEPHVAVAVGEHAVLPAQHGNCMRPWSLERGRGRGRGKLVFSTRGCG